MRRLVATRTVDAVNFITFTRLCSMSSAPGGQTANTDLYSDIIRSLSEDIQQKQPPHPKAGV